MINKTMNDPKVLDELNRIKNLSGLHESDMNALPNLIKDLLALADYLDSYGSSDEINGTIAASEIKEILMKYTDKTKTMNN